MSTLRPLPTSAAVFRGESSRRLHLPLRAAARVGCAGGGGTLPAQTTRGRGLADYPAPHAAHISGATLGAPHPSSAGRRHLAPRRVQSPRPQRGRADQRARVQVPPPIQAGDGPGLDPETDPGPAQADCVSRFTPAALNRCLAVAAGGRRRAWRTRRRRRLDTDCWRGRGRGIGPDRGPFRRPREWQGSPEGHQRAPAGPKVMGHGPTDRLRTAVTRIRFRAAPGPASGPASCDGRRVRLPAVHSPTSRAPHPRGCSLPSGLARKRALTRAHAQLCARSRLRSRSRHSHTNWRARSRTHARTHLRTHAHARARARTHTHITQLVGIMAGPP